MSTQSWQLRIECELEQSESVQALIDGFVTAVQATGATIQQSGMTMLALSKGDPVEDMVEQMRQRGMSEERIAHQKLLMQAQRDSGSWEAVLESGERQLDARRQEGNVLRQIGQLFELIKYAMNAGQRERAQAYFAEAEQLLNIDEVNDSEMPPEYVARNKERMRAELERLRNWLP